VLKRLNIICSKNANKVNGGFPAPVNETLPHKPQRDQYSNNQLGKELSKC